MMRKFHLKEPKGEAKPQFDVKHLIDPMLLFLKACLRSHMRKGSRFSCFYPYSLSKYEDSLFAEQIIVDPNLSYQEIPFSYEGKEALIILIEKLV